MTAMTAATIDRLSDGRMLLGVGSSGPQVAEGWHGQRFAGQLQRTRDYVAVVRMALARERVEYHGPSLELPLPDGPGKALRLMIAPAQEQIPIYLAAIGPKNTALAGEIADGWLPTLFSPEHSSGFQQLLAQGASRSARSLDGFDIAPIVSARVDEDHDRAREMMRPYLALYLGGMGSRSQNFYNRLVRSYGFEQEATEIQELYLAGRKQEAINAVPDDLVDEVALCGPRERIAELLDGWKRSRATTLICGAVQIEALRVLAELVL